MTAIADPRTPPDESGTGPAAVAPAARDERWFAPAVAVAFAILAAIATARHEMWRDELDAWLACRDAADPLALLRAIRYGGHPALWYLLVWPLTRITRDPAAMQALHVTIAACGAFVVARHAPAPRWLRALVVFGYFPLYEYGIIARSYGLGVLGLAAACTLFPRWRDRPWTLGLVLFLTANTQALAMILCVALLAAWLVEAWPRRRALSRGVLGAACLAAAGAALSAVQMIPPTSGSYLPQWFVHFSGPGVLRAIGLVANAHLPFPALQPAFWQTRLLDAVPAYAAHGWALGAVLLALVAAALVRNPAALVYYAVATGGLLALFYTKHAGFLRHHGYLFVATATALWLGRTIAPRACSERAASAASAAERAAARAFAVVLAVHAAAAAVALLTDFRYSFSGSKATAELIRGSGLAPLPLIGAPDYAVMPVVGHLDKDAAYYPAARRWGSHIVWDEARAAPYDFWLEADALAWRQRSPVVVVVADPRRMSAPASLAPRRRLVGCREGEIVVDESFCVFLLAPPLAPPEGTE